MSCPLPGLGACGLVGRDIWLHSGLGRWQRLAAAVAMARSVGSMGARSSARPWLDLLRAVALVPGAGGRSSARCRLWAMACPVGRHLGAMVWPAARPAPSLRLLVAPSPAVASVPGVGLGVVVGPARPWPGEWWSLCGCLRVWVALVLVLGVGALWGLVWRCCGRAVVWRSGGLWLVVAVGGPWRARGLSAGCWGSGGGFPGLWWAGRMRCFLPVPPAPHWKEPSHALRCQHSAFYPPRGEPNHHCHRPRQGAPNPPRKGAQNHPIPTPARRASGGF